MALKSKPTTKKSTPRKSAKKPLTVDWHTHILLPDAFKFTRDNVVIFGYKRQPRHLPPSSGQHSGMVWEPDIKKRLRAMDKVGIDVQVLSSSNVHQCCDWAPAKDALKVHRLLNDQISEVIRARPDRFTGLATVPLQSVPMAVKELDRAVTKLGLRGVNMSSNIDGKDLDHASFEPFWNKAEELDVPIYVHPAGAKDERLQRYFLWNSVGQPYEEAMAMTSLILGGVLDNHPKLNFVMAHGGGFVPHYDGRLVRNFRRGRGRATNLKKNFEQYLKDFYYDTCVYNPDVLKALAKKVGPRRLIMGSDFPVGEFDPIGFVRKDRSLSAGARNAIVGGTAAKLLKLGA